MAIGMSTTLRNARLNQITSAAGNAAKLLLCSGVRPATGSGSPTVLATVVLGTPFAGSASGGVLTLTSASPVTAAAGGGSPGTAVTWARLTTSADAFVADFSVSTPGGGGDLVMDNVNVQTGATVTPGSITITDGNP